MKRLVTLLLLLVFVPSCALSHKRTKTGTLSSGSRETISASRAGVSQDAIRLQEAKLGDIPIPLSAIPLPHYFDPYSTCTVLGYSDKQLSLEQLEQFFIQELERSGWLLKERFCSLHEILLRFKKPTRVSVISIRQHDPKAGTEVVIFTALSQDIIPS